MKVNQSLKKSFVFFQVCGICALTASGSLSQWLRLEEIPNAANAETTARYQLVLISPLDNQTPLANNDASPSGAKSDTKKEEETKSPRLLKLLTDLWDIAATTHFISSAPITLLFCDSITQTRASVDSAKCWHSTHSPPAHRPRGPPHTN